MRFSEGLFPSSGQVFSSLLHKEHSWWLASSPGHSQILCHRLQEKSVLNGYRIKSGSGLGTRLATNYAPKHRPSHQEWRIWRASVTMCFMYQNNFGCHMTLAEFYVSSHALVHLQISTEYLSKSCRTVGWINKVSSRGQSTTNRQRQREGLNVLWIFNEMT